MKLIIFFIGLLFLSCKNQANNSKSNFASNDIEINPLFAGDPLIANKKFITSINADCKITGNFFDRTKEQIEKDYKNCSLSKIKFNYRKLDSINDQQITFFNKTQLSFFLKKTFPKNTNNRDNSFEVTLFSNKNHSNLDSVIVYQTISYPEALVSKEKYYYITAKNLFTLNIVEDENGAYVESALEYRIDIKTGKFILEKSLTPPKENLFLSINDYKKYIFNQGYELDVRFDANFAEHPVEKPCDINQDGKEDRIIVFKTKGSDKDNPGYSLLSLLIKQDNGYRVYQSDKAIIPLSLVTIHVKGNYFTIDQFSEDGSSSIEKIPTFKYDKNTNKILLTKFMYKYSDYSDTNTNKNFDIYTPKQFGILYFEDFDKNTIFEK